MAVVHLQACRKCIMVSELDQQRHLGCQRISSWPIHGRITRCARQLRLRKLHIELLHRETAVSNVNTGKQCGSGPVPVGSSLLQTCSD